MTVLTQQFENETQVFVKDKMNNRKESIRWNEKINFPLLFKRKIVSKLEV